jgi:hypothetical protein
MPRPRKQLLLEAGWALACMAWRVRRWPFARLAATLGRPTPAGADSDVLQTKPGPSDLVMARDVRWAIAAWTRRLRPAPTCLMQAAAAQRLLARRGLPSTLVFGVQSMAASAFATGTASALGAHAWLQCRGLIVTGEREAASFRPIAAYRLAPGAQHP